MQYFVREDSIVREIWGKSDTILLIFAGASAEFALNKAVDWLYYTGKLPSDPLGRLFSTVSYARKIVFAPSNEAEMALKCIREIHATVETSRGHNIPDWAYRDVLYMLIYYSIKSFEVLERKLTEGEKQEVFHVFYRVGKGMGLEELPNCYEDWCLSRQLHLNENLENSRFTGDLFKQYKSNLGWFRYYILKESQELVVPKTVRELLGFKGYSLISPALPLYKAIKLIKIDRIIKRLLYPSEYSLQIREMDIKVS